MKKAAFHNLGCKVNSYEMDAVQQLLRQEGYEAVPFDTAADIYIINTCTVTNIADRKSRQMLHRAKALNPDAVVVALGCYVQTDPEGVMADESIDLAIGNNRKGETAAILKAFLEKKEADKLHRIDVNQPCGYEEMQISQTAEHTRAYIKIQDGCNQFCSYCIIPYARGRVRSRKAQDIRKEVETLAKAGYREIVLTGIHISSYGIDFADEAWEKGSCETKTDGQRTDYRGSSKLLDLLKMIHEVEGISRIRLGSLEPRIVTPAFAQAIAALPKICPHFHLSLQSGAAETLKRMNRHYTPAQYMESVQALRSVYENPAITTDVIVGFPGETEEEFAECKAFLSEVGFYEMHIFKYSKRKGTVAAGLSGQLTEAQKGSRSNELAKLEKEMSRKFRERHLDTEATVLFEEEKEIDGTLYQLGYTADYVRIALQSGENLSNQLKIVRILGFLTDEILISTIL